MKRYGEGVLGNISLRARKNTSDFKAGAQSATVAGAGSVHILDNGEKSFFCDTICQSH